MISPDKYWVSVGRNMNDIINDDDKVTIKWSGNLSDDYIIMGDAFYNTARLIITTILDDYRDNEKCDEWFFPALYLYRQGIELLCKGLFIAVTSKKDITPKFKTYKHNIIEFFNEYMSKSTEVAISANELEWLRKYLTDLEKYDKSSNLFRYPIKDGILSEYNNSFLDIVDMANSIDQCYAIMYKCVVQKFDPQKYAVDIDLTMKPEVLFFASHGIGNCMLYESPWDAGYRKHLEGYSNIAHFLLKKLDKNHLSFLIIAFLMRHSIELGLKNILVSRTEYCVDVKIQFSKKWKHSIYKDLWLTVKDMVEHYSEKNSYDLSVIDLGDQYLNELSKYDNKGDRFRYPTNNGLEYHLNKKAFDFYESIYWLISVFNFVNGCADMLDQAYEYECDMRSEYMF